MMTQHTTKDSLIQVPPPSTQHSARSTCLPAPRIPLNIRPATMDDLPLLDSLQKKYSRQLGYFPTKQFQGYIEMGGVLVAERSSAECCVLSAEEESACASSPSTQHSAPSTVPPLGYVISRDRYLKRDEVGVIYQLCVAPDVQRGFIGASLVKAAFDRAAYGCRLFCCWCAQDIEANYFWEAMGFVPIAFRAGSLRRGKRAPNPQPLTPGPSPLAPRIHIFWQKRIRPGDDTTPYWFPAKTEGGAIREDRIVLPIPPGTRWCDPMPVLLPREQEFRDEGPEQRTHSRQLATNNSCPNGSRKKRRAKAEPAIPWRRPGSAVLKLSSLSFAPPSRPRKAKPQRVKVDPRYVAAARELRDRWLEKINADPSLLQGHGKYEIGRSEPGAASGAALGDDRKSARPLLAA